MSTQVTVAVLPPCDLGPRVHPDTDRLAAYDAKTRMGPWAYLCQPCFNQYGLGLGTGLGQRLILRDTAPARDPAGHNAQVRTEGSCLCACHSLCATGGDRVDSTIRPTIEITRDQLESWARRALTDDEVARLDECIPNSSIPDAVEAIVAAITDDEGEHR